MVWIKFFLGFFPPYLDLHYKSITFLELGYKTSDVANMIDLLIL
jgi:hypothetical protein